MASPITWRNVDAPDFRGAASMFGAAQQTFDKGASSLIGLLDQRAKTDEANWQNQKVLNTQSYLDALGSAKTPEELAAKQELLNSLRSSAGAQIDLPAIRAANDGREAILQNRLKAQNEHADYLTGRTEQPIVDSVKRLYTQGKYEEGDAILSANPNLRNTAALAEFKVSSQTANNNRELSGLELKHKVQGIKDDELISKLGSTFQQSILAKENERASGIKTLMDEFGVPTVDGEPTNPDLSKLPDDKLALFKNEYQKRGFNVGASTTGARQQFIESLTKAGVSASGLVKAGTIADTIFRKEVPLSAEDTTNRDMAIDSLNSSVAKKKEGNIFYTDPAKYAEEKQGVFSLINSTIKDGPMTVSRLRDTASKWMDEGITIEGKDGKPVTVKVPPKVVAQAIAAGAETDTWFVNNTDKVALEGIKKIMTDPMHKDSREAADYLYADGPNQDLKKIKRAYRNNSGTVNADDLSTNLERAIAKRLQTK